MANIDIQQILTDALNLAKGQLGASWNEVKPFATHEFGQFAEDVEFITKLRLAGEIDDAEFKGRLDFQKLSLQSVLITIKGIGLIAAQNIVNGVLDIVATAVKTAFGVALPL